MRFFSNSPECSYIILDFRFGCGYNLRNALAREGAKAPAAVPFYKKRLIRVLPGYLLVLVVSLLLDALPSHRYQTAWEMIRDLLAHLTFTHTLFPFS